MRLRLRRKRQLRWKKFRPTRVARTANRIVCGLGNPGPKYARTRHNVGFRVVDELASRLAVAAWKTKDGSAQAYVASAGVVLVKPLSFMNDSGQPLGAAAAWWKTPPTDVLVVSDDLDLPFGRLRMRVSGGSGGHNGLKSIIARFGEDFPRLRIGIGRGRADTIDYVLANFSGDEEAELGTLVSVAADGVERWLAGKPADAIAYVNGWRQPAREDTPRAS